MKIKVTQADIDAGEMQNCHWCPISHAVRRAYPESKVRIGNLTMAVDNKGYDLPVEAKYFIGEFDADRPVTPFEFEINENQSNTR